MIAAPARLTDVFCAAPQSKHWYVTAYGNFETADLHFTFRIYTMKHDLPQSRTEVTWANRSDGNDPLHHHLAPSQGRQGLRSSLDDVQLRLHPVLPAQQVRRPRHLPEHRRLGVCYDDASFGLAAGVR